jgi:hypothetical protein
VTVEAMNRKEAAGRIVTSKAVASKDALAALQERVRTAVRSVAATTAQLGPPPEVSVQNKEQRDGYHIETLLMHSEPGMDIAAIQVTSDRPGPKPAVLMLDEMPKERVLMTPDIRRLANCGHVILIVQSRGTPDAAAANQTSILGSNTGIALQAMLVGKSLVGMRVDDIIRAVNWLSSQETWRNLSLLFAAARRKEWRRFMLPHSIPISRA